MKNFVIAGLMLVAVPVSAQTADATAKATALIGITSPTARADAQVAAQIKAMRDGTVIRNMLSQNPQIRMELAKNQPAATTGIQRLGTAQANTMSPILKEMAAFTRQTQIKAYASNFSSAELDQLLAFYRSPVGGKLVAQQAQIGQEVAKEVQARFGARVQAAEKSFMTQVQAELPKMFPARAAE